LKDAEELLLKVYHERVIKVIKEFLDVRVHQLSVNFY